MGAGAGGGGLKHVALFLYNGIKGHHPHWLLLFLLCILIVLPFILSTWCSGYSFCPHSSLVTCWIISARHHLSPPPLSLIRSCVQCSQHGRPPPIVFRRVEMFLGRSYLARDYNSQPPLQQVEAKWLSSSQWAMRRGMHSTSGCGAFHLLHSHLLPQLAGCWCPGPLNDSCLYPPFSHHWPLCKQEIKVFCVVPLWTWGLVASLN